MIASIRGKKPHVYRVIILKQMADHTISIYVLHADKELLATDLVLTNTVTYYKVDTIAPRPTDLPAPLQIKIHNCDGKPIIPNARGVYLPCGP